MEEKREGDEYGGAFIQRFELHPRSPADPPLPLQGLTFAVKDMCVIPSLIHNLIFITLKCLQFESETLLISSSFPMSLSLSDLISVAMSLALGILTGLGPTHLPHRQRLPSLPFSKQELPVLVKLSWMRWPTGQSEVHLPILNNFIINSFNLPLVFGGCSIYGENYHYGTPTNPCAPGRVPGGSSSGSAVAVAAGLADFSLGY